MSGSTSPLRSKSPLPSTELPHVERTPTPYLSASSQSAFPALSTSISGASRRLHKIPTRNDGYDNIPAPLPSDPQELERRLTNDPDIMGQMVADDIGPPPEGGYDAWSCVAGAFFLIFCIFGFTTSFGQLQSYYLENQLKDYSKSEVAWISSIQTVLLFSGSIFAGRYFDSHGPRLLAIVGTLLSFGSLIGVAFCKTYWQFFLAHAAFGASGSCLYSPGGAVAGHWFLRKRSTAVGIVVTGSGLAGVIYPIALHKLLDQLKFRDAILIIAGMNAALMIPSSFLIKARLPPRTPPPLKTLLGPWSEPRYVCLVLGVFFLMMNSLSPYFNAPIYASSNAIPQYILDYSIAILQAGGAVGRLTSGFLSDRFGVWNMYVFAACGMFVSLLAFWVPTNEPVPVVIIGLILYGYFSGFWISSVGATCGAVSPTREYGMRLGMLWSLSSIGVLAGPPICGVLVTANDQKFTYAAIFCAATSIIGTILSVLPVITRMIAVGTLRYQDKLRSEEKEGKEARDIESGDSSH